MLAAGGETGEGVVRAGAAVELVHSATLVHDDVLDAAALRRGRPTVVAAAGRAMATADRRPSLRAGLRRAGRRRPRRRRGRAEHGRRRRSPEGELLQREDAWNAEVPVERYLHRCELKTACLFEAAGRLGALEAGAHADALGAFGRRIGLAFQVLDDVLDVSGPADRTGKHRGADLLDGTVTLPFILARRRDPELAALDPRTVDTPMAAEDVCRRIAATGALEERARARSRWSARRRSRCRPSLPTAQRRALDLVADGVVERYA